MELRRHPLLSTYRIKTHSDRNDTSEAKQVGKNMRLPVGAGDDMAMLGGV